MGKLLQDMSWMEAREAFKQARLAVVPMGSVEQHGPHMPLGTDFLIADYLAKQAGPKLGAIVTPVIPIGFASYHSEFAGTLSVRAETLVNYVWEFCSYLVKYGITHILFINGHGGNLESLQTVGRRFRERGIVTATIMWWELAGHFNPDWAIKGHADITETSLMLALAPETIHLERARLPTNKSLSPNIRVLDFANCEFKGAAVKFPLRTSDATDTGDVLEYGYFPGVDYTVSAAGATVERGRAVLDAVVRYIVDFGTELVKVCFRPVE